MKFKQAFQLFHPSNPGFVFHLFKEEKDNKYISLCGKAFDKQLPILSIDKGWPDPQCEACKCLTEL
jgi:hypothetical protein